MGVFLAADDDGLVGVGVVALGALFDFLTGIQGRGLQVHFAVQGLLEVRETVQVLDFGADAERGVFAGAERDVAVAAHVAVFHVGVRDAGVFERLLDLLEDQHGLFGATDVRFGHDFAEWRAAAVRVKMGIGGAHVVDELAGVFFHVDTGDADALLGAVFLDDFEPAVLANRVVVHRKSARLGNLVTLRQVRVEVVLTGPHGVQVDFAVERKPKANGVFHGLLVRNRHGTRHTEANGAHVLVRGRIHFDFAAAEHLRLRRELTMDFKTDNRTVVGHINSVVFYGGKDRFFWELI